MLESAATRNWQADIMRRGGGERGTPGFEQRG